eukprot:CAMPEP_0167767172 /NCGR_PEP_ID=MMETSP0110_2-20121227/15868_1 /TAXON_ID=629695 /ORGANISM="Gymnochlora sp., Strain CCMP2014" /LENGTH=134 /DNA_ID=CAMNT_0007655513 /DNA_START=121 /DNA_END=522 /DNA_ORIENTATION=-
MNRQLVGKISLGCTVALSAILACMLLSGANTLGAPALNRVSVRSPGITRMTQVNARAKVKPQAPKNDADPLWLPNTVRPEWLDGSLPGDRGFDPLGLSKPAEYLQFDVDQLDQNQAVNRAGQVIGKFDGGIDQV